MALGKLTLAALVAGTVFVTFPAGQPRKAQTFAQPAATATSRLKAGHRIVNGTGLGSLTVESAGMNGGALLIDVTRAGDPRGVRCRVTVSAVSPTESRAETDCTQPSSGDQPMRRLGADALSLVVREHVGATIEKRTYDVDNVADSMLALVVMNRPTIANSIAPPDK